jgi:hypothetical protein
MAEALRDQTINPNQFNHDQSTYPRQVIGQGMQLNMGTLENSFIKNTVNKSYERIMADTIEA